MSAGEVKKLIPKLEPTAATANAAGSMDALLMTVYHVENQSVGPLKPCKVEYRFFKDELYEVQFRCPDPEKIKKYLLKTYGDPNKSTDDAVFWMGRQGTVALSPR